MSQERKDASFMPRVLGCFILSVFVPVGIMVTVGFFLGRQMNEQQAVIAIVTSLVVLGFGWFLSTRPIRRYICSQCGGVSKQQTPDARTNLEFRFYCPRCDIIWTTGFLTTYGPEDSTGV